ncbi:MAG: hypothetical protein E7214_10800 [Clostridium sp.]|nr:hypothetical protein [Clostridium sp.]
MILIIIHIIITIVLSLTCCKGFVREELFLNFILGLCFPIGGYIGIIYIFLNRGRGKSQEVKYDDLNEINKNIMLFTNDSIEKESRNIIALEEAMILNSEEIKKEQIKSVFESESLENLEFLKIAVKDNDLEVSHYASTALINIESKLELDMQECRERYEENPDDIHFLAMYIDSIKKYLDSNLVEEHYIEKYIRIYIEKLEKLIKKEVSEKNYINIVDALLKVKEFEKAKEYSNEFSSKYESEESYMKELKVNYMIGDKEGINDVINRIKESSIDLSRNGINIFRFWNMGDKDYEV